MKTREKKLKPAPGAAPARPVIVVQYMPESFVECRVRIVPRPPVSSVEIAPMPALTARKRTIAVLAKRQALSANLEATVK